METRWMDLSHKNLNKKGLLALLLIKSEMCSMSYSVVLGLVQLSLF